MGSSSGNCSASGAVLMARLVLVVLVAVFAGTSSCGAQLDTPALPSGTVTMKFTTLGALLSSSVSVSVGDGASVNIPPGESRDLSIDLRPGPLLGENINIQMENQVYSTPGTIQSMFLVHPATTTFSITGQCASNIPGLQFEGTTALDVLTFSGCAAPVT